MYQLDLSDDLIKEITKEVARFALGAISDELAIHKIGKVGGDDDSERECAEFLASIFEKRLTKQASADIALLLVKHYLRVGALVEDETEPTIASDYNGVWLTLTKFDA